jgi:formate dehydrogenase accessory protein FdhE
LGIFFVLTIGTAHPIRMSKKLKYLMENTSLQRDPTSPERIPLITGIENPFPVILDAINKCLESGKHWEGVRESLDLCSLVVSRQSEFEKSLPGQSKLNIQQEEADWTNPVLSKDDFLQYSDNFPEMVKGMLSATGLIDNLTKNPILDKNSNLLADFMANHEDLISNLAQKTDLDGLKALFALNSAYQILVAHEADLIRKNYELSIWHDSICPICGSGPEMGRIVEQDGHYYLSCSLCFTEWKYPRIKCPFCGCDKQDQLGFFTVEEYPGHRVNFCRECNTFIKVSMEKQLGRRHVPIFDNILTLELDSVALDEGFVQGFAVSQEHDKP